MRRGILRLGERGLEVGRMSLEVDKVSYDGWIIEVWRLGRWRFGGLKI